MVLTEFCIYRDNTDFIGYSGELIDLNITKYADIRRRMAEKEAVKARRGAVGFVPKFALYRKAREHWR